MTQCRQGECLAAVAEGVVAGGKQEYYEGSGEEEDAFEVDAPEGGASATMARKVA